MSSPPLLAHSPPFRPQLQPFMMRNNTNNTSSANSQLDEGYSEETRSQPDSDMVFTGMEDTSSPDGRMAECVNAVVGLPAEKRQQVVLAIIRTLDNNLKDDIRRQVEAMTHFDPASYLPIEVFLQVFAYLSPKDLLNASTVSRAWRERAFDERLWQLCFAREGWILDKEGTEAWERGVQKFGRQKAEALLQTAGAPAGAVVPSLERRESRKRRRGEAFSEGEAGSSSMNVDGALDGARSDAEDMEGLETTSTTITEASSQTTEASLTDNVADIADAENRRNHPYHTYDTHTYGRRLKQLPPTPADLKIRPTILQSSGNSDSLKLSWPYLYKQRRRLESNWDRGHFKTFQLPQLDYPEDGHTECVYTIQHTARHLVSGSRDMTIRIWDLQTYRPKCDPLRGHKASVLCLQFDERPEQDIIVSGGSDSSVIIWKFSTGELVKHLEDAHDESVLNLRFDDRYIVTCSKDKTIKIWNRHALARDSPLIPTAVIDSFADPNTSPLGGNDLLIEPFTLLSTIRGHGAAVNAVMIHDNTIVSASGDRTVKAWDIITGKATKNYQGHSKGIACVQFDGRRVVSGSSDNTVRIFDAEQQAEVACLNGHNNLVRTVQARFGDLETVTDQDLAAEAREADREWMRAVARGMQPASITRRGATRSAGSSRPEDMLSVGAKIPPGGGGSAWAKIVSGSYDETVIVWRKDAEGNWKPKLQLNQAMLLREMRKRHAAGRGSAGQDHLTQLVNSQGNAGQVAHIAGGLLQALQPQGQGNGNGAQQQQQQGGNVAGAHATLTNAPVQHGQHHQHHNQHHHHGHHQHNHGNNANANANANGNGIGNGQLSRDSFRIFKLQFDARRIICCSQNKVIVGWDFANGEKELEKIGDWSVETA